MSNDLTIKDENELLSALKSSVYVDASDEGLRLVLSYCNSLKINPMSKPVHLVKMGNREVIMNGIALYRIMADRTGCYLGLDEPVWGETVTAMVGNTKMSYPLYCKLVGRKKLPNGEVLEIAHTEYWLENYGTINDKKSPNVFWYKRPFAQLYKCVEAQVLRRLFPDTIINVPSYEEMQTEVKDETVVSGVVEEVNDKLKAKLLKEEVAVDTKPILSPEDYRLELIDDLKALMTELALTKEEVAQIREELKVATLNDLDVTELKDLIGKLTARKINEQV